MLAVLTAFLNSGKMLGFDNTIRHVMMIGSPSLPYLCKNLARGLSQLLIVLVVLGTTIANWMAEKL